MEGRTKALAACVAALALLVGAWAVWSPRLAIRSLTAAAARGDEAAMSRSIDDAAVRRSLQEQIAASMALASSDAAAREGRRLRGDDAKLVYRQAAAMVAHLSPAQVVSGMLVPADGGQRDVETRRLSALRFEAGPPGTRGGLQFELRGARWTLVGIARPTR